MAKKDAPAVKKSVKGYILNIKVKSNERKGEKILFDLFKSIHAKKLRKAITADREAVLRTFFVHQNERTRVAYGHISSAIDLTGSQWLNILKSEGEKYPVPEHLRAKLRETEYILIEKAHRVFVQDRTNGVSKKQAQRFFEQALRDVLKSDETAEVIIEKDGEEIKEIFQAATLEWIKFDITRSNNDTNKDSAKWLEDQLDDINATGTTIKFTAKSEEGLNPDNKIMKGALQLVASNGSAEARIIDENGKGRTVRTNQYEKRYDILVDMENAYRDIANFILKAFNR